MTSLIPQVKTVKSAAQIAADEKILRARAGMASFTRSMAEQASVPTNTAPAPKAFLSGFGGASNMPEASASKAVQRSALEAVPANVRTIATRTTPEGLRFMSAILKRYEEAFQPVTFSSSDAASIMGLRADQAEKITDNLIFQGLLVPRNGRHGGLQGYQPVLPAA